MKKKREIPFAVSSKKVLDFLLDPEKSVSVYRNLHNGKWSIRQGGIVRCHADAVYLKDAEFAVGAKGRERVLKEKRKNVHAFVRGKVADIHKFRRASGYWYKVGYNPYKNETFVKMEDGNPILKAKFAFMDVREDARVLALGCR